MRTGAGTDSGVTGQRNMKTTVDGDCIGHGIVATAQRKRINGGAETAERIIRRAIAVQTHEPRSVVQIIVHFAAGNQDLAR